MFLHPEKRLEEDIAAPYLTLQILNALLFIAVQINRRIHGVESSTVGEVSRLVGVTHPSR